MTNARVGLPRRLLAALYDAIACIALVYFAAFVPVVANGGELTGGNPLFGAYLLTVVYLYFVACWTRGHTLGMQAWKVRLEPSDGATHISWRRATQRFAVAVLSAACLGCGFWVALLDSERRTWHDRWSHTRLVRCHSTAEP
jgi:uncharacterized RDD family membrane protein YckC